MNGVIEDTAHTTIQEGILCPDIIFQAIMTIQYMFGQEVILNFSLAWDSQDVFDSLIFSLRKIRKNPIVDF